MDLTWESMGEVWGELSFRPKLPQKGRGHLKHDFRLTKRLLPDSTMTYRGRSDGLVVESDRKLLHLNVVIYATYKDIAFIHQEVFFFPRQCVAPIALTDKPPLFERCLNIQLLDSTMTYRGRSDGLVV